MTAQPVKRQKLSASVTEELMALIARADLRPGQRLPPERQLAEQMGVSRASVRDAVARLEVLGHLGVRQGDGIYVQEPTPAHLTQPFQGILARLPQTAADLLEFRRMVEPEVAALAAQCATDKQIAALRESLERQREQAARGIKLGCEDLLFHGLIAQMAGNGVVMLVLDTLRGLLSDLREQALAGDLPQMTLHAHGAVVQAIAGRDPEAARQAMLAHLDNVVRTASPPEPVSPLKEVSHA